MPTNPAYQPSTYDQRQQEHRRYLMTDRSGYRSDDPDYHDRPRERSRDSRSRRRSDGTTDDDLASVRRSDGYSSEPDRRRDRGDLRSSRSRDRDYDTDERSRNRDNKRDDRSSDRYYKRNDRSPERGHSRDHSRDRNYSRDDRRRDEDRFHRQDDRHDPEYYHYDRDSRPHYDPREHPYYYPSKDMFHPPIYSERDPRFHPYFMYEGDMHRQPFYMYNPMDVYNPQFMGGPYMAQPYPYRQYNQPRRKRSASSKKSKKSKKDTHVEFDEEVEERDFDPNEVDPYLVAEVEQSKLRARLGLLIFLVLLLIASVVIGAIACALEPWWFQEEKSGTTTFEILRVGLWQTCFRPDTKTAWVCHKYSEKGFESPYESITLLQWSMIVGSICAFISLTLAIIAVFGRKSRFLMGIVYAIIFFAIGATVLFGLVVAYVNEDKKTTQIVGSWTKVSNVKLETGAMFALGCAAVATAGLALIICCVFAFIYEPHVETVEIEEEDEGDEEMEGEEPTTIRTKPLKSSSDNKKEESSKKGKPKRQGTKYVKKDKEDGKEAKNKKEPAVITKDKESSKNKKEVRQPEPTPQPKEVVMLPRQSYMTKTLPEKKSNPIGQRPVQNGLPIPPRTNTNGVQPVPPQYQQNRQVVGKPSAQSASLYDGDYDNYFNTPY